MMNFKGETMTEKTEIINLWSNVRYTDCESENFRIKNFNLDERDISMILLRERLNPRLSGENHGIKAGNYVKLEQKKPYGYEQVMSNTPMELDTNMEFIVNANGKVLIGGLGLGLIVQAIQNNHNVDSIIIVEKNKEIIALVKPQLIMNKKVSIVEGNIDDFKTNECFDTIYLDIWNNICSDEWEHIKRLKQKFKKNLNKNNPKRWLGVWRETDFRE